MDYLKVVQFCFDWLKTKDSSKLFLQAGVVTTMFVFLNVLWENFARRIPVTDGLFIAGSFVSIMLTFVLMLVSVYLSCKVIIFALKRAGKKTHFFGGEEFFEVIKILIAAFFRSVLWCQNRKIRIMQLFCFFAIAASGLALVLIAPGENIFAIISLFLFILLVCFFYFLAIWYSSIRYNFSMLVFLESKKSLSDCLQKSWEITRGSVIEIFAASLCGAIVYIAVFFALSMVLALFFFIFGLVAYSSFSIAMLFFSTMFGLLLQWLIFLPQNFLGVAVYSELTLQKHKK